MPTAKIHFLGAAETVTGSKFLVETEELNVLIDCGMFQGLKELRVRNWEKFKYDPEKIDLVLLTHGHLDHCGYLPRLVKQGFKGQILGTAPSIAVADIVLTDSAKINEEEAEKANKEGYSKHQPALPLYTRNDVENTRRLFRRVNLNEWIPLSDHIGCRFQLNGHIIGSAFIELKVFDKVLVFSGDIGRSEDHLLEPPVKPIWADYLFLESTYGNKLHPTDSISERLTTLVREVIRDRGVLIIPSFAVERLQVLMYILWKLYHANKIPNIPIFVDSPMGNNVLSVFRNFSGWHKLSDNQLRAMIKRMNIIQSYRETWETIDDPRPKIVIAGSGMVTGGRVLTYLQQLIDVSSTVVLLVGYQAEGTRGRRLLEGEKEIKIRGKHYPVEARIEHIESLSAHGDQAELISWISEIKNIPEQTFLIHGEPTVMQALKSKIERDLNWHVRIPKLHEVVEILV